MSHKKVKIRLRPGHTSADLGSIVAEKDSHLADYYIDKEKYVDRALNLSDPAAFFVGPKGSGKSAILQMVRLDKGNNPEQLVNLSPTQLAFSAFANIDVASPLLRDASKKQWLYKSLWDYILSTEIGGREFPNENSLLAILKNLLRDKNEVQIRKLLKMSVDDDGKPSTISSRFMRLLQAVELSGEVEAGGNKIELTAKMNPGEPVKQQFNLLGLVHDVASRLGDSIQRPYYVLIDDLDVDWHNEPTQNEVIAAMFSSLRKICRPPYIKSVVSLQDRIFRELPIEHKDKFRDAICDVVWTADSIKEMLEKRIRFVLDVSGFKIWGGLFTADGFDYIWKRTTGKPREAIRFASICLETARREGHSGVSAADMEVAFRKFSAERLDDIGSELNYSYPGFMGFLTHFAGFHKEFPLARVQEAVDTAILACLDDPKRQYQWVRGYEQDHYHIARVLLENNIALFKRSRTDPPRPYDPREHHFDAEGVYLAFHPMYWAALGLIGNV
jgi:hypothetical protein